MDNSVKTYNLKVKLWSLKLQRFDTNIKPLTAVLIFDLV